MQRKIDFSFFLKLIKLTPDKTVTTKITKELPEEFQDLKHHEVLYKNREIQFYPTQKTVVVDAKLYSKEEVDHLIKTLWATEFTILVLTNEEVKQTKTKVSTTKQRRALLSKREGQPLFSVAESVKGQEWEQWYVKPDTSRVRVDRETLNRYWWWIVERLRIYHNRVILKKPAPWTKDVILTDCRFTNISRDMDRVTIYERNAILDKLNGPKGNTDSVKKSVLFNIFVFRIFVKPDTYEKVGYINLEDPNWKTQWEKGKKAVKDAHDEGEPMFTGSYFTNPMCYANPDPKTRGSKVMNAFAVCEYFLENLDYYYEKLSNSPNMKEGLEILLQIPGIGSFNSYELASSIAMINRYYKNTIVSWTQDNYTNVGPGAKKGIDWIFTDRGNLTPLQCIIYLRSVWEQELKRLGYYDEFVEKLPEVFNKSIDLRVIEHCLCEFSKYQAILTGVGRIKKKFSTHQSVKGLEM